MIPLDAIEHKKRTFTDGSVEFRASLELRAYNQVSPMMMADIDNKDALEEHIKDQLTKQIWYMVYGDLTKDIFELIHLCKMSVDPSMGSLVDIDRAIRNIEAKLK